MINAFTAKGEGADPNSVQPSRTSLMSSTPLTAMIDSGIMERRSSERQLRRSPWPRNWPVAREIRVCDPPISRGALRACAP